MTPEERATAMNIAVAGERPLIFTRDGVTIRAEQVQAPDSKSIAWNVLAWTGQGNSISYLPLHANANPFIFVNPPLMVPDGQIDSAGNKTFIVDALSAAKEMLFQAVTKSARQQGWVG